MITHAHSDHARRGSGVYLCSMSAVPLLRGRLGNVAVQSLPWGEKLTIGAVQVSFHPAGHILGSAQICLEYRGYVMLVTGDFKCDADPTAEAWEAVQAHAVLSECTFGLPVYRWPDPVGVIAEIAAWWEAASERSIGLFFWRTRWGRPSGFWRACLTLGPAMCIRVSSG